jgi:hypothetical protein
MPNYFIQLRMPQRMKWIGIHAASGSNSPKIELRLKMLRM